ncbi:glycosyltransferase family 2 protein [Paenibacillus lutrae]|uniref:Glycosyltransferase n=1 Tax=Paenibacillus lutrae TaxID=2078573 RepID=A0A7X3K0W6_9BACL|nr:glycosyltransferase family A protein [Paenibacillus lutrae]MVP01386.1 glycosyltransferase [Paenibacillus lutrae]
MNEPLVSIVIPTFNRPFVLSELLETIALQNYPNLETLIVNDAGESVDFVREAFPELNIKVSVQLRNLKHVHARNLGCRQARGEFIMLCDDDDLLTPGHIRRMLEVMADGADLAYSDAELFNYRVEGKGRVPVSRRLFAYAYDPAEMRKFSTFIPSGCLYRRQIHSVIGEFDPDVYHYWDWDFILRVSALYSVVRLPVASVLYAFSDQGGNLSANRPSGRLFLDRLAAKHGLGPLPSANFATLLDEPHMQQRSAQSSVIWDGLPVKSRINKV